MFGLDFLFAAALWALPLAGLPLLLHLLFRQKSPVIPFSTLRFVKTSLQRTAARRRIQKWLLLACRALLIALLIWAIAQPARRLASSWGSTGGARSINAAIVVDCSYSMQLQDAQLTLLAKADGIVQDLLRNQLAGAKAAIFRSAPPAPGDGPERLRDASAVLSEWSPLKPQANPKPLVDRVAAAVALLERVPADQKWLVVISDFQSREFGRPLPQLPDGRTVLLDLHPAEARSAGVTDVTISPRQPIPGVGCEAVVDVTGRPGDSRAVALRTSNVDGTTLGEVAPTMANFDAAGHATVRFPIKLPPQRWVMLTALLTADDAMMWDNQRSRIVEVPPKQSVVMLSDAPAATQAERFVKLALDPSEGKLAEWPLAVRLGDRISGNDNTAVAVLRRWPDRATAIALRDFARAGHAVILFLQPGIEDSWPSLPAEETAALAELLPSPPVVGNRPAASSMRAVIGDPRDPLLEGLTDERFQLNQITVHDLVSMNSTRPASAVLGAVAVDPGAHARGLLYRKPVGSGVCFTISTAPESRFTNLATHPLFLPMLVRMALPTADRASAKNTELGAPLALDAAAAGVGAESEMQVEGPQHQQYRVKLASDQNGKRFVFDQANEPGVYTWRRAGGGAVVAVDNVQLPAGESDLTYRPAQTLASGPNAVVATSITELSSKIAALSEPEPQWSTPIAIVLLLLCFEALMGSAQRLRKPAPTFTADTPRHPPSRAARNIRVEVPSAAE
jgi:hypothetical protein